MSHPMSNGDEHRDFQISNSSQITFIRIFKQIFSLQFLFFKFFYWWTENFRFKLFFYWVKWGASCQWSFRPKFRMGQYREMNSSAPRKKFPFFLGWTWDQIHLQRVPTLLNLVLFELGTLSSSYNIVLHRNQMILASNLDPFSAWKSTFHTTQVHVPSLFWHKSDQVKIYVFGIMFFSSYEFDKRWKVVWIL